MKIVYVMLALTLFGCADNKENLQEEEPITSQMIRYHNNNNFKSFNDLLAKGYDPLFEWEDGSNLLYHSCATGQLEWVKILLPYKANINELGEFGGVLHYAVAYGNCDPNVVSYLLENGANPFLKVKDGTTPYDIAIRRGDKVSAEILQKTMVVWKAKHNKKSKSE